MSRQRSDSGNPAGRAFSRTPGGQAFEDHYQNAMGRMDNGTSARGDENQNLNLRDNTTGAVFQTPANPTGRASSRTPAEQAVEDFFQSARSRALCNGLYADVTRGAEYQISNSSNNNITAATSQTPVNPAGQVFSPVVLYAPRPMRPGRSFSGNNALADMDTRNRDNGNDNDYNPLILTPPPRPRVGSRRVLSHFHGRSRAHRDRDLDFEMDEVDIVEQRQMALNSNASASNMFGNLETAAATFRIPGLNEPPPSPSASRNATETQRPDVEMDIDNPDHADIGLQRREETVGFTPWTLNEDATANENDVVVNRPVVAPPQFQYTVTPPTPRPRQRALAPVIVDQDMDMDTDMDVDMRDAQNDEDNAAPQDDEQGDEDEEDDEDDEEAQEAADRASVPPLVFNNPPPTMWAARYASISLTSPEGLRALHTLQTYMHSSLDKELRDFFISFEEASVHSYYGRRVWGKKPWVRPEFKYKDMDIPALKKGYVDLNIGEEARDEGMEMVHLFCSLEWTKHFRMSAVRIYKKDDYPLRCAGSDSEATVSTYESAMDEDSFQEIYSDATSYDEGSEEGEIVERNKGAQDLYTTHTVMIHGTAGKWVPSTWKEFGRLKPYDPSNLRYSTTYVDPSSSPSAPAVGHQTRLAVRHLKYAHQSGRLSYRSQAGQEALTTVKYILGHLPDMSPWELARWVDRNIDFVTRARQGKENLDLLPEHLVYFAGKNSNGDRELNYEASQKIAALDFEDAYSRIDWTEIEREDYDF